MEMTIDEAIEIISDIDKAYRTFSNIEYKAMQKSIDTLRKYQEIQEIVRWNNAPSPYYKPDGQLFREICEVLEDGQNTIKD